MSFNSLFPAGRVIKCFVILPTEIIQIFITKFSFEWIRHVFFLLKLSTLRNTLSFWIWIEIYSSLGRNFCVNKKFLYSNCWLLGAKKTINKNLVFILPFIDSRLYTVVSSRTSWSRVSQDSTCCRPRELVSFVHPRDELYCFDARHVLRSRPIKKMHFS